MGTYLISDTHFDDKAVIDEFNRPFDTLGEMNDSMIERWNETVSDSDTVIVVGDFARVDSENEAWVWFSQLNGDKILVDGNHRPVERSSFSDSSLPLKTEHKLSNQGHEFYCAHKLEWIPETWDGWRIFGHVHNRSIQEYPFIDPRHKRVNISAELLDYTPISLDNLVDLLSTGERYEELP